MGTCRPMLGLLFVLAACGGDGGGGRRPSAAEAPDADADGVSTTEGDCDDSDPAVHPGFTEVPYDGVDQDCDGRDLLDVDGDGAYPPVAGGGDCDDLAARVHPGAEDLCGDGIDQDCDGADLPCEVDLDRDGYTVEEGDCDDADATMSPGGTDIPYDGRDQDCFEGDRVDVDADGFVGTGADGPDCDDETETVSPVARDRCGDGVDQDCDGADLPCGEDVDGDGFRALAAGGDDCDDGRAAVHPGAVEVWFDRIDQDCDGADGAEVIEGVPVHAPCWFTGPLVPTTDGFQVVCGDLDGGLFVVRLDTSGRTVGEPLLIDSDYVSYLPQQVVALDEGALVLWSRHDETSWGAVVVDGAVVRGPEPLAFDGTLWPAPGSPVAVQSFPEGTPVLGRLDVEAWEFRPIADFGHELCAPLSSPGGLLLPRERDYGGLVVSLLAGDRLEPRPDRPEFDSCPAFGTTGDRLVAFREEAGGTLAHGLDPRTLRPRTRFTLGDGPVLAVATAGRSHLVVTAAPVEVSDVLMYRPQARWVDSTGRPIAPPFVLGRELIRDGYGEAFGPLVAAHGVVLVLWRSTVMTIPVPP